MNELAESAELLRLQASVRSLRRERALRSPYHFCQIYLRHCFTEEPSPMHVDLFRSLAEISSARNGRVAVAAPRGHAKSTVVTLGFVLWSMLSGRERYALIISATKEQAAQHLKHIREEIASNPLLAEDFPECCGEKRRRNAPWRDYKIRLSGNSHVHALGSGQKIRGLREGPNRPSLIIVDDLEELEACQSAEQREKTREWFAKTLLKAVAPGANVVVIGTVLHYDSLLAHLLDPNQSPGWDASKYQAVLSFADRTDLWDAWSEIYWGRAEHEGRTGKEAARAYFDVHRDAMLEGSNALWPEREPYEMLMEQRLTEGQASFDAEKQNEPLDPQQCLFSSDSFRYWDEGGETFHSQRKSGAYRRVVAACDPSLGKPTRRHDDTAIVVLGITSNGEHDVVAADLAKRKPAQIIERVLELAVEYGFDEIAVETNQFQEMLAEQLEREAVECSVRLRIRMVNHTNAKHARIQSLEPLISTGRLRFGRGQQGLLDQLRQFPLGAHDDGPDALEMAVSIAKDNRPRLTIMG